MDNRSQQSDIFSFEDASQDVQLTLTQSQIDGSSIYTPYVETDREKLIWGTSVNVQKISEKFKEFVRNSSKYMELLGYTNISQEFCILLDCNDLDDDLKKNIIQYPQEIIPIFGECLREIYMETYVETPGEMVIQPYNIGRKLDMRNIRPQNIDTVIELEGLVMKTSQLIPDLKRAVYRCVICARKITVEIMKGMVSDPTVCECGGKLTYILDHNAGEYADKQVVKIQELTENVPIGSTPTTVVGICRNILVDKIIPGDRVLVSGILRVDPQRINPHLKKVRSVFRVYMDILYVETKKKEAEERDYLCEIDDLIKNPNVYEILSRSIAPSVYGMDSVKKGLLLQLVGGVSKDLGGTKLRGDINILLAGDPGISKSQLLSFIHGVSDRGMYTSGRGSSAVGLTASVSRDVDTGQFILESGALVLSDHGVCCIDEFDKMDEITRSVLHEVMEQQTVSIAKAGIITTLNARCSILASCNPQESKYNMKKTIVENLNLPPTLLSRFDLVCLLIDRPQSETDRNVAQHIVSLYTDSEDIGAYLDRDLLRLYIKEARKITPVITEQSASLIADSYSSLRQLDNGESITATTRQLESIVRLSEAHAKIRFSKTVDSADVKEAVRLIKENLLLYAVDPKTGRLDLNMLFTGKSTLHTKLVDELKETILKKLKGKMERTKLLEQTSRDEALFVEALQELEKEDLIYVNSEKNIIEKL